MKKYQKPNPEEIQRKLTRQQFEVTQNEATEPPFQNQFWNHEEEGLYVDVVSGEPLFTSRDKFDSGCGWPSFDRPIEKDVITNKTDFKIGVARTEIRSKIADSHLGHVFTDGPTETGLRYCINSAALRFIPIADLEKEGYSIFLPSFTRSKKSNKA